MKVPRSESQECQKLKHEVEYLVAPAIREERDRRGQLVFWQWKLQDTDARNNYIKHVLNLGPLLTLRFGTY